MHLELVFVRGEECDCWLRCIYQKRVILQVYAYFLHVTVDHGLQLWNLWSSSPVCDVVSLANSLDRGSRPCHISYVIVEQGRWQLWSLRDAGADDSRARHGTSEASCSLSPSQVAGQPSSDGGWQGRSGNLGYQCVMRHCIKGSCQVLWPHTLYDEVVSAGWSLSRCLLWAGGGQMYSSVWVWSRVDL